MTSKRTDQEDGDHEFRPLGLVSFIVVVALFAFVSDKAGMRGLGLTLLIGAALGQRKGRISYGWEGRPPSGYITGWLATALCVLLGLLGLGMVIWPAMALGVLG